MAQESNGTSWRDQLSIVKDKVVEAENRKELERKLQIQRTRDGIAAKLAEDTPEEMDRRFREMENDLRAGGRELYPGKAMQSAGEAMEELTAKAKYYQDAMKEFPDLFPDPYPQTLKRLEPGLARAQERSAKQIHEWSNVGIVTDGTQFRKKEVDDEPTLIHIAKTFHKKAHGIDLNLPKAFFSKKSEGLWVATFQEIPYAYCLETDVAETFSVSVGEVIGTNFVKLVRGLLHRFCTAGPVGRMNKVSVHVTSRDEVKFYTHLNFLRTATRGMSDWTYTRKLP